MASFKSSLFAAIFLGLMALSSGLPSSCNLPGELREDCGYLGITQGECEGKGCCWSPISGGGNFPWCFYSVQVDCGEYEATEISQTPTGLVATIKLINEGCEYYGVDIPTLKLQVDYETDERLHVKITDASAQRWEVPESVLPRTKVAESNEKAALYRFGFVSKPFGFHVARADTGEVIFNSSASIANPQFKNLVYEDQYLELSTQLPSGANIYGLGERVRPLRLAEGMTYTLWNADEPTPVDQNLYGFHPYYMEMRNNKAHGVLLLNSNGMDIEYKPGSLSYRMLGGILDFYFFMGPTPAKVTEQYTQFVGRPYLFPYWAFGFHQCKYGYKNIDEVKAVVQGYADADIPLETMWIDIDYMDRFMDWTFDPINFPVAEVKKFIEDLHSKGQKNVLIVDPGIKNLTGYKYYELGLTQDVFIKSGKTHEPMLGMVWPYYTVFPDFLNPATQAYWTESVQDFLNMVPVDGLWIDMNEVANFCTGDDLATCSYPIPFDPKEKKEADAQVSAGPAEKAKRSAFDPNNPNYKINNANIKAPLNRKTTSMDAYHHGGALEYDAHNIYGITETIMTTKALELTTGKRAFVLSRSTYPGSGKHGGHWTGDNFSEWIHLYYSIPGMLNFQIFGIPYVGADICGFIRDTTEELCARWMQLGSFYPFARNHNTLGALPQEPYLWPKVAEVSRISLGIRYSLLPLYYTLNYEAHQFGHTIVRPLFFEFPSDPAVLAIDKQFFIGRSILASPVVTEGAVTVDAYLPRGRWYDFYSHEQISSTGQTFTFSAPLEVIPLHLRGGVVLIQHYPGYTTTTTRKSNFHITAALDEAGSATGTFYDDDGESLNNANHTYATFTTTSTDVAGSLTAAGTFGYSTPTVVDKFVVLGVKAVSRVTLNGQAVNFQFTQSKLTVSPVAVPLNKSFTMQWFA